MARFATIAFVFVLLLFGIAAALTLGGGDEEPSSALRAAAQERGGGRSTAAIELISKGEKVELAEHASPRGMTIFEFTADW